MTGGDARGPAGATLRTSDNAADPAVSWKVKCLNCGAALVGPFCAECGQRALPPHPTVKELAGDALSEISGWDGKLAETVRTLMRKPGELTRQWIEGRRAAFISPLRLYLTTSLIYFVVIASAPNIQPVSSPGNVDLGGLHIGTTKSNAGRLGAQAQLAVQENKPLTGPLRDSALAEIATAPAILQPMFRRAIDEPGALTAAIRHAMPRVLIALLPVMAGLLALFYRGRHYPEHLYFAIHLSSFYFVVRTLGNLALFPRVIAVAVVAQLAVFAWLATYAVLALRRVYGGSIPATIGKLLGVCVLYALIAAPVILVMAVIVAS